MIPMFHRFNVEKGVVKRLKGGKSPGIDVIAVEYLERAWQCVLES